MRLSNIEGVPVIDARGRSVGKVERSVFDPAEPKLIGVEVRMRPFLYLIERPRRYVSTAQASLKRSGVRVLPGGRLEREGGTRAGIDWERTVVWRGMPVFTEDGTDIGKVDDAELDAEGRIVSLLVTGGAMRDTAVGRREVPAALIKGFDGDVVRVSDEFLGTAFTGGFAAGAGRGAAMAKVSAQRAAKAAEKGVVTAGVATVRAVRRSRAKRHPKGAWKGFVAGIKEGMSDEERRR